MISLNCLACKISFPFRNVPASFGFSFQNYLWGFVTRYDISIFFFLGGSVSQSVRSLKCCRVLRLVYKVCEVLDICLEICEWFEILGLSAQV